MSLFVKRDLRGRNADPTIWRYLHEAEAEIDRLQIILAAAQERAEKAEADLRQTLNDAAAESAKLRDEKQRFFERLSAAEALCAELREALRPFAAMELTDSEIEQHHKFGGRPIFGKGNALITVSHILAARTALAKE